MAAPPPPPSIKKLPPPTQPAAKKVTLRTRDPEKKLEGGTAGVVGRSAASTPSAYFAERSETCCAGLSNLGATCYLNSLLQTLFMTKEFRKEIYGWKNERLLPEDQSIPYQLQALFARMQIGLSPYVDPFPLTKSFGWADLDNFLAEQHDIQELQRVLFEALSVALQSSPAGRFTSAALYKGSLNDYIRCLECGNARTRLDEFQDIALVIKGMKSLEQALYGYVEPELLNGGNQWMCDQCGHKVDAIKGLKFETLPAILTFQLRRFDFDWSSGRRIKINDWLSFPFELDMSPLLENSSFLVSPKYELFSVLVHSGGAMGGHYFNYTKNIADGKWIQFNDAQTCFASVEEVKSTYGDEEYEEKVPTDKEGEFKIVKKHRASRGNAYMLVYRRVEPNSSNPADISAASIPDEIQKKISEENQKYLEEKAHWRKTMDLLHLKVICKNDIQTIIFDRNLHLSDLLTEVVDKFGLKEKGFEQSQVRLRNFNASTQALGDVFQIKEAKEGEKQPTLSSLGFYTGKNIYVETRAANEEFPQEETKVPITVIKLNQSTNDLDPPVVTYVHKEATYAQLQEQLSTSFNIPASELKIATMNALGIKIFTDVAPDTLIRKELGLIEGSTIHIEASAPNEASELVRRYEEEQNRVEIRYNAIDSKEYNLFTPIDKRKPLKQLKALISQAIGIPVTEFKLKKTILSKEYRDENASLESLELFDGCSVFVQLGAPLLPDQHLFAFFLYNFLEDSFEHLEDTPLSENMTLEDLKKIWAAKLGISSWNLLRLREKQNKPGRIFLENEKTLKENFARLIEAGSEKISIAIQKLDHVDNLKKGDIVLEMIRFYPSKGELSPKEEVVAQDMGTVRELKMVLASLHPDLLAEQIGIAKPFKFQLKDVESLFDMNWEVDDQAQLGGTPWYLRDGEFLLYCNLTEHQMEVVDKETGEVKKRTTYAKRKETGISIHVYQPSDMKEDEALKEALRISQETS